MNYIFQEAVKWPVLDTFDVVVVGAGPGGFGAAVAAARLGAKTILIEKHGFPGGMATLSDCIHLMGFGIEGRQVVGGIPDELARRMNKTGDAYYQEGCRPVFKPLENTALNGNVIITEHGMRVHTTRMLKEAGVHMLFYASVIGAQADNGRITSVAVDCVEGPCLIKGKTFIDATGDAHLIYRAGGETLKGSVEHTMAKTLLFELGGVPHYDRSECKEVYRKLYAEGNAPFKEQDTFIALKSIEPNVVHVNFTMTAGDALQSSELTRMDRELREQITTTVEWLKNNMPQFKDCYLIRSAFVVGVRGGRSGVGLETVTCESVDTSPTVSEPVVLSRRGYGGHGLQSFFSSWGKRNKGPQQTPWKALLSRSFENVAMAGRCISSDPKVLDTFRLMVPCMAIGEAAGVNAAFAVHGNGRLVDVGYDSVRTVLLKNGAILD